MIWVEYGWKYILYYHNQLIINNIDKKNDGSNIRYKNASKKNLFQVPPHRLPLVLIHHVLY